MPLNKLKLKTIPVSQPSKEDKEFMEKSPSVDLPYFRTDAKQMPEVKNWEQGEFYKFVVEVKMKSKRDDERGTRAEFEIVAYKPIVKKSINEMTDKEFGEHQGEELSKANNPLPHKKKK